MTGLAAEQLVMLSKPYQGKDSGEQEYELAVALVQVGEGTQIPDLGPKDLWLRIRDELARKVIEQRVLLEATGVVAAGQVLTWADSGGLDSVIYQVPLAVLTAMVIDSVINAMGGDNEDDGESGK